MGKPTRFTPERRATFLEVLGETASVTKAAAAAGVHRRTCYEAREADPEFREAWERSLAVAMDKLVEESFRRAHDGYEEPVVSGGRVVTVLDADGKEVPFTVRKYSDALMQTLLKGFHPERFTERTRTDLAVSGGLDLGDLNRLSREDRAALRAILAKAQGGES